MNKVDKRMFELIEIATKIVLIEDEKLFRELSKR